MTRRSYQRVLVGTYVELFFIFYVAGFAPTTLLGAFSRTIFFVFFFAQNAACIISLRLSCARVFTIQVSDICIGNSVVSSAIWKKKHARTSEFFKGDQNCTSPKDECNLKSLKNSRVYVFSNCTRNHTIIVNNIHEKI